MRLTVILLLSAFIAAAAEGEAQGITLSQTDAPLDKIFHEIEKQSSYEFLYAVHLMKKAQPVTINVKNLTIQEVLKICFVGQPFTYVLIDHTVVVKPKKIVTPGAAAAVESSEAPPIDVKGRIVNENGEPVVATISVKGTDKAVSTSESGEFILQNVDDNAILIITAVNIQTREVRVNGRDNLGAIVVHKRITEEESVMIRTGYQDIPKERATGSFVKLNNQTTNRTVSANIIDRIEGLATGVLFNREPLNRQDISIRGRNTIFGNAEPLIVVDGFPYDGDISNINPNDVQDITILKDAAAASIWGARAGNGVIVIETKTGKYNSRPTLSFTSNVKVVEKLDLFAEAKLSPADYIKQEEWLFENGYYNSTINSVLKRAISPAVEIFVQRKSGQISAEEAEAMLNKLGSFDVRTDLMKYMYRDRLEQQNAVSFGGGGQQFQYYLGAGYDKSLSEQIGDDYQRITLTSTNALRPLNKLELSAGVNFVHTTRNSNSPLFNLSPYNYEHLVDDDGNPAAIVKNYRYSWITAPEQSHLLDWQFKPVEEISLGDNVTKGNDIRLNIKGRYTITDGLSADLKYQYQYYTSNLRDYMSPQTFATRDIVNYRSFINPDGSVTRPFEGGILDLNDQVLTSNTFRGQLNFSRNIAGKHGINAIAGTEVREIITKGYTDRLYGYDDTYGTTTPPNFEKRYPLVMYPNATTTLSNRQKITEMTNRFLSHYFNASYSYLGRYLLSGSARRDASNLFGVNTNQKSVPLWSLGASWVVSGESFYNSNALPFLKLRLSYGYNGNIRNNVTALLTTRYSTSTLNRIPYASVQTNPDPTLKWEKVRIVNIGVDFKAKNNVVSGTLEFYHKFGNDLFGNVPLPPSSGVTSINVNSANTVVRGFDLTLNTINLKRGIRWETTLMLSGALEKVTKYLLDNVSTSQLLNNSVTRFGTFPVVGRPLFSIYSYKWAGLDPQTGDPRGYVDGSVSSDYSKLGSIPYEQLVYSGPIAAPVFGSLMNTFEWKRFTISANLVYKLGHVFRRESVVYYSLTHGDYYKRWQKPGDEQFTDVPSDTKSYPFNYSRDLFYRNSEATVENASHVRLQDLRISYTVSNSGNNHRIRNMEVFIYGNNLGIIWRANKEGLDPESPVIPVSKSLAAGLRFEL